MSRLHQFNYANGVISLSGVKEVMEFNDKEILLSLEDVGLKIEGKDLKMKELALEEGDVKIEGTLFSLSYGGGVKEGFWKRIFK